MMLRLGWVAVVIAGCSVGDRGPVTPATPDVAADVVERILAMDCDELAATETLLGVIAQGQQIARVLLASGQLAGTGITGDLIGQTEAARTQTGQLVDFMQLVRLCNV